MTTTPSPTTAPGTVTEREAIPRTAPAAPRKGRNWATMLLNVALLGLCLIWMVPVIGLLITSVRNPDAAASTGWWTVLADPFDFTQWTLQNYREVLLENGMGSAFLNSFVVALPSTIVPIMIAAFAAYAFTFMQFPGRDWLFIVIVGLLVIPTQVAFVPLLRIYGDLGLNGTFLAVWLAHAGFGMPLAIYLLRTYMAGLPNAVVESAKVDGASHFVIFWRLVVPMSVPALAAFAIFQFLWTWNDLLVALLFIGSGPNEVVTVNLAGLIGSQGQNWQLLTAGAFI
ncbi:MAG: carbohydrate ABC transporter permease, partial [Actinomycetota bacterium]|nr:carbohydrate ABC transporter permease [Actinomycetota bacterium]